MSGHKLETAYFSGLKVDWNVAFPHLNSTLSPLQHTDRTASGVAEWTVQNMDMLLKKILDGIRKLLQSHTAKILIPMTFNWAKWCSMGKTFLSQDASNGI